jgi:hypothetical protein
LNDFNSLSARRFSANCEFAQGIKLKLPTTELTAQRDARKASNGFSRFPSSPDARTNNDATTNRLADRADHLARPNIMTRRLKNEVSLAGLRDVNDRQANGPEFASHRSFSGRNDNPVPDRASWIAASSSGTVIPLS